MGVIPRKYTFISVIVVGMISFLLFCNQLNYRHFNQLIETAINQPLVIDSNILNNKSVNECQQKSENLSIFSINGSTNRSYVPVNSIDKSVYFLYNSIHEKVLQFESKSLVPTNKPSNSRLLYADQIRDITVMTIGDHQCDNSFGRNLTVVVIVISRVDGFTRRSIIRNTWAQKLQQSLNLKLYFAIGLTKDKSIQKKLETENERYGDLLQWNFMDNYYNLTIKSLGILRWITLNCFQTKFIYKVDDDCIVNYQKLLDFCDSAQNHTIYGHLWRKAFVDRKKNSKFFISRSDYAMNSYPDYTGGPWLMSGSVVPLLYETAITKSLPALPYEDVYITGVVASKSGIDRKQLPGLVYFSRADYQKLDFCWFNQSIIFWQNLDDSMLINGWNKIQSTSHRCLNTTTDIGHIK